MPELPRFRNLLAAVVITIASVAPSLAAPSREDSGPASVARDPLPGMPADLPLLHFPALPEGQLSVRITSPKDRARVDNFIPVRLHVMGTLPKNARPVLVIRDPLNQLWIWSSARPDPNGKRGDWWLPRVQIGVPEDRGMSFRLIAVVTRDQVRPGLIAAIPSGPQAQITVTRR